jgi:hypothetical protein
LTGETPYCHVGMFEIAKYVCEEKKRPPWNYWEFQNVSNDPGKNNSSPDQKVPLKFFVHPQLKDIVEKMWADKPDVKKKNK